MRLTDRRRSEEEDDFAEGFVRALSYVQRRVVARVVEAATSLTAAGAPQTDGDGSGAEWGAAALLLATPSATVDPVAVYDPAWWRAAYARYVRRKVNGLYSATVGDVADELDVDLGGDPTVGDAFDDLDSATADGWGAGLADFVASQVRAGVDDGDTVDGLAARLRGSDESWFGPGRAALLAAVAVATTFNRATLAAGVAARAKGVSSTKTWVSVGDDRVRDTHVEMDGVSVDIGDDFLVAGVYPASGPHDERLPVEEVANCRCVLAISNDGGDVADESTTVEADGVSLDYDPSGGSLTASAARGFHTHGHCAACGAWLEGRKYCRKCGAGYSGPLLEAGTEAPPPADPDVDADLSAVHNRRLSADSMPVKDVGLVAADGVDQEDAVTMTTTAPFGVPPAAASTTEPAIAPRPASANGSISLVPWSGVVAVEGRPTGDGRMFRPGALYWDESYLPADLFAMLQDPDGGVGHDGSMIAGRIDRMWRVDNPDGYVEIWAEGVYDTATPVGAEVLRLQTQGMLTGVSVDVDSVEVVMPEITADTDLLEILFGGGVEEYTAGRIRRATVCSIPAFIEARIYPVSDGGALVASAASEGCAGLRVWTPISVKPAAGDTPPTLVASAGAFPAQRKAKDVDVFHSPIVDGDPPADVFARRDYREYTPFTVDADGRLSGHCSSWDACHIGFTDRCVLPPRSRTGYAHARTGHVLTAEGDLVPTARVFAQFGPGRRGHAPEELGPRPAVEWYENLALALADVAIYEDKYGIQIQGRMRPGATRAQVVALRASRISPDWRTINGALECVGLAVVNVSGFTNSAQAHALVASAIEAGVDLPDLGAARGAAWVVNGEVLTLVASGGPDRDPTVHLAATVQRLAARVDELEQAELARQTAALLAGVPSEEEEQARLAAAVEAVLAGVDLAFPDPPAADAADEAPPPPSFTVAELATLRAAAKLAERFAAAATGDTVTCPNCGAEVEVPADGMCPVCGEPLDGGNANAADQADTAATVVASCGGCHAAEPCATCAAQTVDA